VQRLVQMNEAAVKEHQVSGTPTFLINNNVVPNSANWKTLEPAIQQALR
jgi:protein-disulfide isomerase